MGQTQKSVKLLALLWIARTPVSFLLILHNYTLIKEAETMMTIHFNANLRPVVKERLGMLHWIMDPAARGFIIAYDLGGNQVLIHNFDVSSVSSLRVRAAHLYVARTSFLGLIRPGEVPSHCSSCYRAGRPGGYP